MNTLESLGYEVAKSGHTGKWYWRNIRLGVGSLTQFRSYFEAWDAVERLVNRNKEQL